MEIERVPVQARNELPVYDETPKYRGRWNQALLRLVGLKAPSHAPTLSTPPITLQRPDAQHSDTGLLRREVVRDADNTERARSTERIGQTVENEQDAAGHADGPASKREGFESPPSAASASVFSNMSASVGRSVLSATSGISSVGSISVGTDMHEVQKGVFVAPKVAISGEHLEDWNVIRPRLEDTLRHLFKPAKGLDPTMSLEFMLAGPSRSQLSPSIIIVCCSNLYMKQLKKFLKSQKWIGGYGYPCMVLVDPLKQLAGPVQEFPVPSWTVEEAISSESDARRGGLRPTKIAFTSVFILTLLIFTFTLVLSAQKSVYRAGIAVASIKRAVGSEQLSSSVVVGILSTLLSILLLITGFVIYRYCHDSRARSYRRLENLSDIRESALAGTVPDNYQQFQSRGSTSNHGPNKLPGPSPVAWPSWREEDPQNHIGVYSGRHRSASITPDTSGYPSFGGGTLDGQEIEMVTLHSTGHTPMHEMGDWRSEPTSGAHCMPNTGMNDIPGPSHETERTGMLGSIIGLTELDKRSWSPTLPPPHSNSAFVAYNRVDIFARVPSQNYSMCGVLVEAVIYPAKHVSFTLGGVILVGDRQYGLTTRHSFTPSGDQLSESGGFEETEDEDEDDSPYISFDDDANNSDVISSPPSTPSPSPLPKSSDVLGETLDKRLKGKSPQVSSSEINNASTGYEHIGVLSELGFRYSDMLAGQEEPSLDWALIELDGSAVLHLKNTTTPLLGDMRPATVSSIIKTDLMEDSQVLIQAGVSGPTTGWLRSCPVHMHFHGSSFLALQIVLDGPLAPGDSGAWVVREGRLYGHIIATRDLVPLAYMLPIESIFDDIRLRTNIDDVRILVR